MAKAIREARILNNRAAPIQPSMQQSTQGPLRLKRALEQGPDQPRREGAAEARVPRTHRRRAEGRAAKKQKRRDQVQQVVKSEERSMETGLDLNENLGTGHDDYLH